MNMMHMLDTDTASYIIKGRSTRTETKLMALPPSAVCISVITRAELMYGLKRLDPKHRLQISVRRFLALIQVLSWQAEAADYYAEIRHQLVTNGQPIGEMDMMIAAHALAVGAVLVTNNHRHYKRIKLPLELDNWV